MKKQRITLLVSAFVLLLAIMAMGTLAYLTNQANDGTGVTNTFTAAGGGKLIEDPDPDNDDVDETFTLYEHTLTQADDGTYTLTGTVATATDGNPGNAYEVLPGVNLPKDPQIDINKKTTAPAYLFVEVVDKGIQSNDLLSYALTAEWVELEDVTGAQGGVVYVYQKTGDSAPTIINGATWTDGAIESLKILKDDQIVVADGDAVEIDEDAHLDFYAYLAQANAGEKTPTSVYMTCFGGN